MNMPFPSIKTGHADCQAFFCPALYRLTLVREKDGIADQKRVDLGYAGSRLLERLLLEPGIIISRDALVTHAWQDRIVGPGSLNQQIHALRQILGDDKERLIIQTLPGRGYLLNPEALTPPVYQACPADPELRARDQPPTVRGAKRRSLMQRLAKLLGGVIIVTGATQVALRVALPPELRECLTQKPGTASSVPGRVLIQAPLIPLSKKRSSMTQAPGETPSGPR